MIPKPYKHNIHIHNKQQKQTRAKECEFGFKKTMNVQYMVVEHPNSTTSTIRDYITSSAD